MTTTRKPLTSDNDDNSMVTEAELDTREANRTACIFGPRPTGKSA